MKVSLNTIRFINERYKTAGDPAADGIDALISRIGGQLGAVEEVLPFGERFTGAVIVRVVSCAHHPDADRLHVCKVDDGGTIQTVERDPEGNIQVVCGAPNVRAGMLAVWLPPGMTVPSTYKTAEPFILESRLIRGQKSNGMLASPKELTIGDYHEGILEVDNDVPAGTTFTSAYNLDGEVIIDIENKMFTHRPDCFGLLGIARELAGIQHQPYSSPEWYLNPVFPAVEADVLPLEVHNELPELVPRFCAVAMSDVVVKPSPVWLQIFLAKMGLRPVNNIVDYTNFFMLETGQPIHAYDYDKVKALDPEADHPILTVRHPKTSEEITLLNGKTIELSAESMMVACGHRLICLGGAMGGSETEVDEQTKNIIIEAANWDMYNIRRTAMAHGIFSDAVTRFSKGQSPLQNVAVLAKIVDEIRQYAGGKVASTLIDDSHLAAEVMERQNIHPPVKLSRHFVTARLGLDLSIDEMAQLLRNVEFNVQTDADELNVAAPFWRTDIEIREDVVEEIGRLRGYDKLPLELPKRELTPAKRSASLDLKTRIARNLQRMGANELLTYSFVHGKLLEQMDQDTTQAFRLSNALSPELQYYRLSLTPSLLDKVHANIKAGYGEFALFEINEVYGKSMVDEQGLPKGLMRLGLVFAAEEKRAKGYTGAPYYVARAYLDGLLMAHGLADGVTLKPLREASFENPSSPDVQMIRPFEPDRSAVIIYEGHVIGVVGEYRAKVRSSLKLPAYCAGVELFASALGDRSRSPYIPLSRFPRVEQDICLRVPTAVSYARVYDFVQDTLKKMQPDHVYFAVRPIDIYQKEGDTANKQITLRLDIASYERTLTDQEVNKLLDAVAHAASQALQAERL